MFTLWLVGSLHVAQAQAITRKGDLARASAYHCSAYVPSTGILYTFSAMGGEPWWVRETDVSTGAALPLTLITPVTWASPVCTAVGDAVYIADYFGFFYRFDAVSRTFTELVPPGSYALAMAASGTDLYVEGGHEVRVYDTVTEVWSSLPAPSVSRYSGPDIVVTHGYVYRVGGSISTTTVERLDLGDPTSWENFGAIRDAVAEVNGGMVGDYFIYQSYESSQLTQYNVVTGTSKSLNVYLDIAPVGGAAVKIDNLVWFTGGATGWQFAPSAAVHQFTPTTSGLDTDGDTYPDPWDDDDDNDGVIDWQDPCPAAAVFTDTDGDGTCDPSDACPLDPDNDLDGDGVCGDVDPCPVDAEDDGDGDGSCDVDDLCLGDDGTGDVDGDGVCGDVDPCPVDVADDSDGDSLCDSDDQCVGDDFSGDNDGDGLCNDLDFVLSATSLRAGQVVTLTALRAPAGRAVQFFLGTQGFGVGPCPVPGVCGSLTQPRLLGTVDADPAGTARLSIQVPSGVPTGRDVLIEAVWRDGPAADVSGALHRRTR